MAPAPRGRRIARAARGRNVQAGPQSGSPRAPDGLSIPASTSLVRGRGQKRARDLQSANEADRAASALADTQSQSPVSSHYVAVSQRRRRLQGRQLPGGNPLARVNGPAAGEPNVQGANARMPIHPQAEQIAREPCSLPCSGTARGMPLIVARIPPKGRSGQEHPPTTTRQHRINFQEESLLPWMHWTMVITGAR